MEGKMRGYLDVQEMPGDTRMRQEAQGTREGTPHDRMQVNLSYKSWLGMCLSYMLSFIINKRSSCRYV